jgi:uncharacterized membrane protein
MKNAILVASALATAIALSSLGTARAAHENDEHCYGIGKAGANDCKSGNHACANQSTADRDGADFVFVPIGTCAKIAGGSLQPAKS